MIVSLGAVAVTTGMLFHRQVMDARVAREAATPRRNAQLACRRYLGA
jgi:hypothetical protein